MPAQIIKTRDHSRSIEPRVIKRQVTSADEQARAILARARSDAETIEIEAKRKSETLFEEARRSGYEEGLAHWSEILVSGWKARDQYLEENEPALIQLAVRIAQKIIGEELRQNSETVLSIVRQALRAVRRETALTLYVNPQDEPIVRTRVADLRTMLGEARRIEVESRDSVSRGGCLIKSNIGSIDAQIETQLAALEHALLDEPRPRGSGK